MGSSVLPGLNTVDSVNEVAHAGPEPGGKQPEGAQGREGMAVLDRRHEGFGERRRQLGLGHPDGAPSFADATSNFDSRRRPFARQHAFSNT